MNHAVKLKVFPLAMLAMACFMTLRAVQAQEAANSPGAGAYSAQQGSAGVTAASARGNTANSGYGLAAAEPEPGSTKQTPSAGNGAITESLGGSGWTAGQTAWTAGQGSFGTGHSAVWTAGGTSFGSSLQAGGIWRVQSALNALSGATSHAKLRAALAVHASSSISAFAPPSSSPSMGIGQTGASSNIAGFSNAFGEFHFDLSVSGLGGIPNPFNNRQSAGGYMPSTKGLSGQVISQLSSSGSEKMQAGTGAGLTMPQSSILHPLKNSPLNSNLQLGEMPATGLGTNANAATH